MRASDHDGHIPVSRTESLDKRAFHEGEREFSLALDVLRVEGPKLLFELLPFRYGYGLGRLGRSLSFSGSLLICVWLVVTTTKS